MIAIFQSSFIMQLPDYAENEIASFKLQRLIFLLVFIADPGYVRVRDNSCYRIRLVF